MRIGNRQGGVQVEIGVAVLVAVMVALTLRPQFRPTSHERNCSAAEFDLARLRAVLQSYRAEHQGRWPRADERTGTIPDLLPGGSADGKPADPTRTPYLDQFPENPFTGSRVVRVTQLSHVTTAAISPDGGGWLYNPSTGQIWLDSIPGYTF